MEIDTQETVQECLELLRHGSSLEECLELYPDLAEEMEPILRSAISVRAGLQTDLPTSTRNRIKGRVLTEWDRQRQPKRRDWRLSSIFPRLALIPRSAFVAASLIVVLVLAGLGTNTASANSVPGDVLYPVKEFRESVQLWFARSPERGRVLPQILAAAYCCSSSQRSASIADWQPVPAAVTACR